MNDTRQTCQKTVWMYWENPPGGSKPAYLDLCLETIQKHLGSFELKLLDERSVTDYIALPKTIRHPALPLDRKADYIRYALLYKYGGVWFDCDLILLRDVDALVTPGLEQSGFVIFAEIGGGGRRLLYQRAGFGSPPRPCQRCDVGDAPCDELHKRAGFAVAAQIPD